MSDWSILGHPTNGWFAQLAHGTGWVMDNTLGRAFPSFVTDGTEITATAVGHWSGTPFTPAVYERAARVMATGLPANATPLQRAQTSADAHRANLEVQRATASYQEHAVNIATLPAYALSGGSTAAAGRTALIRLPARFAINTAAIAAVDLPARETASLTFDALSPGPRPGESLGSSIINVTSPGKLRPNAVRQAREGYENAIDEVRLIERINMLIRNGGNELTIADLDLDGDGVLTQRDADLIRQRLGNDQWTGAVFRLLRQQGITFENQSVSELSTVPVTRELSDGLGATHPHSNATGSRTYLSAGGWFSRRWDEIWSFVAAIWDGIKSIFCDSSAQPPRPSEPVAKTPDTQTQPMVVVPPGMPIQFGAEPQR
jgi:hypothetical protein